MNTAQQQQILALNCLISAYSLAALYMDGIKSGEAQMIATGALLTVASLAFSFAKPVPELSPVPPLRSVFHPAYSVSLAGQLLIHLGCMVHSLGLARLHEPSGPGSCAACGPPPTPLSEGTGFVAELAREVEKRMSEKEAEAGAAPQAYKFTPSLLNTVVFLVTTAQQVSVMFVNYKGRPFMQARLGGGRVGGCFCCPAAAAHTHTSLFLFFPFSGPIFPFLSSPCSPSPRTRRSCGPSCSARAVRSRARSSGRPR